MQLETSWSIKGRQEGLVQGRQEGLVQGRQEGLVQGRQEGRQEGMGSVVIDLLRERLGRLPRKLQDQVKALPPERLRALACAALHLETTAELAGWLQRD